MHPDDVKGVARKAVAKVRVARVGCHRRIPVGAARGIDTVDFAQLAPEGFFELLFALFPRLMEDRGKAEVVAPLPDLGFNKDAKIARERQGIALGPEILISANKNRTGTERRFCAKTGKLRRREQRPKCRLGFGGETCRLSI